MRIVGDDLSYHNLFDEYYEDGFFCCYFMIGFLLEFRIPNIEYQMYWKGWINDKRLGEKNEISLSLPLSLSLCLLLCVCTYCTYVGRCSLPISHSHSHSHIQSFKSQPLQSQPLQSHLTVPHSRYHTQNRIFPSSHPIPCIHSPMYCTVPYLQYVDST